jgi:uncharacterized protein with PQ loop repeat
MRDERGIRVTPHWVGILGTAVVMLAFVPQVALLLKTRRAGALSVKSTALNMTAAATLFAYALLRGDPIFIAVMAYQLAAGILILVLNIRYRGGRA